MDESHHPDRPNAQLEPADTQQDVGDGSSPIRNASGNNSPHEGTLSLKRSLENSNNEDTNAFSPSKRIASETVPETEPISENDAEKRVNGSENVSESGDKDSAANEGVTNREDLENGDIDSEKAQKEEYFSDDDQSEVDDDLDLDALMAQLQQHTEKAATLTPDDTEKNQSSVKNLTDSVDSEEEPEQLQESKETELSIEQQLKGALSSLELEGGDLDLGLDKISQLLKENEGDQSEHNRSTEDSSVSYDRSLDKTESTTVHNDSSRRTSTGSSEVQTETNPDTSSNRAESLISLMPPPPAHLHGKLPPMPPPPPAFTSPITSTLPSNKEDTASRRSSGASISSDASRRNNVNSGMGASGIANDLVSASAVHNAAPNAATGTLHLQGHNRTHAIFGRADAGSSAVKVPSQIPKIQPPRESEPPAPLRKEYQNNLLKQIEEAQKPSDGTDDINKNANEKGTEISENDHASNKKDPSSQAKQDTQQPTPLYLNENNAILNARRRSILLLDSLAYQVLETLSCSHYQETLSTVMQAESERGMIYRIVLDAFEDVKRIYMTWETASSRLKPQAKPEESRPFLSYSIPGVEPTRDNLTTIQRVNVATFVAALFGSVEIGFWELDEWFIKVFVPETGRLLKQQANIYLDLKTQAYISAVEGSDDKEIHKQALDHLFPTDLETKMQVMLGVRAHLAPQEKDFVAKCHRRRDNILSEDQSELAKKYHWVPFLREVSDYISKNHNTLLPPRKRTVLLPDTDAPSPYERATSNPPAHRSYPTPRRQAPVTFNRATTSLSASASNTPSPSKGPADKPVTSKSAANTTAVDNNSDDIKITNVTSSETPRVLAKVEIPDSGEKSASESKGIDKTKKPEKPNNIPSEGHPMFPPLPKQVLPPPGLTPNPPPKPTKPTETIALQPGNTLAAYEAAKASAEGTDAIRPKSSMFTTRRTWSKQEEEALLRGMDKVQGPYWSQILELYGPGGKISEVLKDRTQVQLKDKARNLKMFFVRLGLPIPAVFQYVTGDYESRKSSGRRLRDKRLQHTHIDQKQHLMPSHQLQQEQQQPNQHLQQPQLQQPQLQQQMQQQMQQQTSKQLVETPSTSNQASHTETFPHLKAGPSTLIIDSNGERLTNTLSTPTGGTYSSTSSPTVIPENSTQAPNNAQPDGNKSETHITESSVSASNDQNLTDEKGSEELSPRKGSETDMPASSGNETDQQSPHNANASNSVVSSPKPSTADDIVNDLDDKDDLNTLLDRVGKYVENH